MSKWIQLTLFGLMLALILLVPAESDAQSTPDRRIGMTEVFWLPEEARDLGVGWERILFYWREIQPEGPEDWNTLHVLEEWLVEAENQGRDVVGLIKNTAPWASEDGTEAGLPKGLYLPPDHPDNLWANYVGRLADYYGPRGVHHWIVWNEPEIKPGVYGYEFAGTAADYYQLLKTASKVMKDRDPQAVIHLAGLTWWHDPTFLDRLLSVAAADPEGLENGYFFDVISLHIYFRTETVKTIVEDVDRIQAKYNLDKPIWINEMNAPPNQDPEWPVERPRFDIDLDQQAWFIIQATALGFASGVERVSVYKMLDIRLPLGDESFGVLRPDQSRRPAYDAYKMATRCFGGFDDIAMEANPLYYRVTFSRPGSLTHVAWSRTPNPSEIQLEAGADRATLLRVSGSNSEVLPDEGYYQLQLPAQRCGSECLVGGEPLLLVEAQSDESQTKACIDFLSSEPWPAATSTSQPTVTPAAPATVMPELIAELVPEQATAAAGLATAAPEPESNPEPAASAVTAVPLQASGTTNSDPSGLADASGAVPEADTNAIAEQAEAGDGVGLWILGLGIGLALIIAFVSVRTRTGTRP